MPENRLLSTCILLLLSLLLKVDPAEGQERVFVLRGELSSDSPTFRLSDYQVQLVSPGSHMATERARVASDGTFLLQGAFSGVSQVRVLDQREEVVYEDYVTVQDGVPLAINLRTPEQSHVAAGKISAHELAHPVPEKAIKEYARAKKAMADGDFEKTVEHFQKAVEVHPQFFQAWNDLGVAYVRQKHLPEAAEAFQKAADIVPENQVVQMNLRITLHNLHLMQAQRGQPAAQP